MSHKDLVRSVENEAWILQSNALLALRNDAAVESGQQERSSGTAGTSVTAIGDSTVRSSTQYDLQHLPAFDTDAGTVGRSWQTLSALSNTSWQHMSHEDIRQINYSTGDSPLQLLPMNNFNSVAGTTGGIDCHQFNNNHNLGLLVGDSGLSKQAPPHRLLGESIGTMHPYDNHNTEAATGNHQAGMNAARFLNTPNLTTNFADNSNTMVPAATDAPIHTESLLSNAAQQLFLQNMQLEFFLNQQKSKLLLLQQQVHSFSQSHDIPSHHSVNSMNNQIHSTSATERRISMPGSLFHATFRQLHPPTADQLGSTIGTKHGGDEDESNLEDRDVASLQDYSSSTQERGSAHETFPMKLHRLLADLETRHTNGTDIASFTPDGLSFLVKDTVEFETKIMPLYFPRMKHFASFQRQLNLYDFQRVGGRTPHKGAYRHDMFLRSLPQLARQMRRTKRKGQNRNVDFLGIGNFTGL